MRFLLYVFLCFTSLNAEQINLDKSSFIDSLINETNINNTKIIRDILENVFQNNDQKNPFDFAIISKMFPTLLNSNFLSSIDNQIILNALFNSTSFNSANVYLNFFNQFLKQQENNLLHSKPFQDVFNNPCGKDIKAVLQGLKESKLWAQKMLDSSAKIQPGLLNGNIIQFGTYEECINIKSDDNIKGQYCTAPVIKKIVFDSFMENESQEPIVVKDSESLSLLQLMYSVCVPFSCTANDLQNITNAIENATNSDLHLIFTEELCSYKGIKREVPLRSVIALAIFTSISVVIILATIYELLAIDGEYGGLIKCFSLYSNGIKLFSSKISNDTLGCLNGLRVISMMWIVIGHRFILTSSIPAVNSVQYLEQIGDWYSYPIIGIGFAVDTFFVISGLLIVYLYFVMVDKGIKFSISSYYLHRIIRLTPALAMMVLVYCCLINLLESEPFPLLDLAIGEQCRKNWWSTMLYVENYVHPNDLCMAQSWYLGIDTQLYFLAPLIFIPLKTKPKLALFSISIKATLAICSAFTISWYNSFGATYLNQGPDEYKYLYTPTHIRVPAWLFGVITGYFIYRKKEEPVKLSNIKVLLLWILALSSMLVVLYSQSFFVKGAEYKVFWSSLYNSLARPVWSFGVCLVILLCSFGYGGWINKFLSCSVFNVLIRLNYSIYLVHMLILYVFVSSNFKAPLYLSLEKVFHEFWGDYAFSFFLAILWTLMFESPIIALEKYFKNGRSEYVIKQRSGNV